MPKQIFCSLLILLAVNLLLTTKAQAITLKFTQAELQKKVMEMMPVTKKKFLVTVVISNPLVTLPPKGNHIQVKCDIEANAPGNLKTNGTIQITGSLSYNREKGSFHLKNPSIDHMHIEKLSPKMLTTVKNLSQTALIKVMHRRPVFTLKDDKMKHKLAKAVLKSVEVKDGILYVNMGM